MYYEKLIAEYLNERGNHEKNGITKESATFGAFYQLTKKIAEQLDDKLQVFYEYPGQTQLGKKIFYDVVLIKEGGLPLGVVENSNSHNDLDKQIALKKASVYTFSNILFNNGYEAVLIQHNKIVAQAVYLYSPKNKNYSTENISLEAFDSLLHQFFSF